MFGKTFDSGWKKLTVFSAALAAVASLSTVAANALPNLVGRELSVNTTMQHDKTAGIDYKAKLKITSQDALGNFVGKYIDQNNVMWNASGKIGPYSQFDNYAFSWSATTLAKALQFSGVINAPVPATQYHKVTLFATGTYLRQNYYNGQWQTYGPAPMSLTADDYYVYTYPGGVVAVDPSVLDVSP